MIWNSLINKTQNRKNLASIFFSTIPMDAFQRIAYAFRKDCENKLKTLETVNSIIASSDTVADALHLIFSQETEIYPGDYEQIRTISLEMDRLRNCIDATEVMMIRFFVIFFSPLTHTQTQSPSCCGMHD